jgi:acyl carrier protein
MKRETLKALVAEIIEADPVDIAPETDLRTLPGFDSVNILALMIALDERAGIRLSPQQAASLSRLREIEEIAAAQGIVVED